MMGPPIAESSLNPRSLAPGTVAILLSSAAHAALLLPLMSLAWIVPGPEAEPPKVVEVTLAWTAPPEQPISAPSAPAPPRTSPAPQPLVMPRRMAPTSRPQAVPVPAATSSVAPQPPPLSETGSGSEGELPPLLAAAAPPPPRDEAMMAGYAKVLLARLDHHKRYPALSLRRGEEGIVTIRLTLSADGTLVTVRPTDDDAPARLVEASLAAVRDAAPFPPLPTGLQGSEAVFTLPMSYRLR